MAMAVEVDATGAASGAAMIAAASPPASTAGIVARTEAGGNIFEMRAKYL